MTAFEVNFDGLVGPTHNYAGLASGNLASQEHRHAISNPRQAALQGLSKMKFLADLGVPQAVLPPHPRPDLALLRQLGFAGTDADVIQKAHRQGPELLAAAYSASSMWAANAATVSPSADAADGRLHFTPANLISHLHRSIEPAFTSRILRAIFPDESVFAHHDPLPAANSLSDEGAANHMRLCLDHTATGLEIFVFGRDEDDPTENAPKRWPARQTSAASRAIARAHRLDPSAAMFLRQHPDAIDAGVFHNDVIAVANRNVLLADSGAFAQMGNRSAFDELRGRFESQFHAMLHIIQVQPQQVSLADSVKSYLFNSQLVDLPDGSMALIAPNECREVPRVREFLDRLLELDTPIESVHFLDVRQSMQNGGGPACLRLRVVLTPRERTLMHQGVLFTGRLFDELTSCVNRHYRERLGPDDLADPHLAEESRRACDAICRILGLESLTFDG